MELFHQTRIEKLMVSCPYDLLVVVGTRILCDSKTGSLFLGPNGNQQNVNLLIIAICPNTDAFYTSLLPCTFVSSRKCRPAQFERSKFEIILI